MRSASISAALIVGTMSACINVSVLQSSDAQSVTGDGAGAGATDGGDGSQTCNPVRSLGATRCPSAADACYLSGSASEQAVCQTPGSGALGTACAVSGDCLPGLTCVDGDGSGELICRVTCAFGGSITGCDLGAICHAIPGTSFGFCDDDAPTCTSAPVTPSCAEPPAAGQACNPSCQTGCACGRCNVVDGTPTCVPAGIVGPGDACTPGMSDNCAPGLVCLGEVCGNGLGRCYQYCTSDQQCSNSICQISIETSTGADTGFKTCDVPFRTCNPVANTGCPNPALNCYLTSANNTLCDCPSKQSGQYDAPCTIYSDCAPGFICIAGVGGETEPHCHFLCSASALGCPAGTTCHGLKVNATYGYCGP